MEQSTRKASMVARGDGKFWPFRLTPESLQTKQKMYPDREFQNLADLLKLDVPSFYPQPNLNKVLLTPEILEPQHHELSFSTDFGL